MTLERRLRDVVKWAYANHHYNSREDYENDLTLAEKPNKTTADLQACLCFVSDCEDAANAAIGDGDEEAHAIRRVCASAINELSKLLEAGKDKQKKMSIRHDSALWEAENQAMCILSWLNVYEAERDKNADTWSDVATLNALCVELDEISKKIRAFVELRTD